MIKIPNWVLTVAAFLLLVACLFAFLYYWWPGPLPSITPTKSVEPSQTTEVTLTLTPEPTETITPTVMIPTLTWTPEPTKTKLQTPTVYIPITATFTPDLIWFDPDRCDHHWGVYGQLECYCDYNGKPYIFQGVCPAYYQEP